MTAKRTRDRTNPDQEYRAAMRNEIAWHWAALWDAVPAALAGKDPEAVHAARVASRRLRAAMDVATDCFPATWFRPLHRTAKVLTRTFGAVRDCDVLLDAFAREREHVNGIERQGIDYLVRRIRRDRKRARKAMIRFFAGRDSRRIRKETRRRFPVAARTPGISASGGKQRQEVSEAAT